MDAALENKRSDWHIVYALISVACPFIAYGLIPLYQQYAYEWLWQLSTKPRPLDDADLNAGGLMVFVIVIQAIFAVGVGCVLGLLFAAMSLRRNPRVISFGSAEMLFNL